MYLKFMVNSLSHEESGQPDKTSLHFNGYVYKWLWGKSFFAPEFVSWLLPADANAFSALL